MFCEEKTELRWERRGNWKVSLFPTHESFVNKNSLQLNPTFLNHIKAQCQSLVWTYELYFPEDLSKDYWIHNPFTCIKDMLTTFSMVEKEQLFEWICDSEFKRVLPKLSLHDLWVQRCADYSEIVDKVIKFLLPFTTLYICVRPAFHH